MDVWLFLVWLLGFVWFFGAILVDLVEDWPWSRRPPRPPMPEPSPEPRTPRRHWHGVTLTKAEQAALQCWLRAWDDGAEARDLVERKFGLTVETMRRAAAGEQVAPATARKIRAELAEDQAHVSAPAVGVETHEVVRPCT